MKFLFARRLHKKFATILIAPFLWILLTGAVLWFLIGLRESTPPYALEAPSKVLLSPVEQMRTLPQDFANVARVTFSKDLLSTLQVRLKSGDTLFYKPGESQPLAQASRSSLDEAIHTLEDLHRGKIAGDLGRYVFSILGLLLTAYIVTGFLLIFVRAGKGRARSIHRWLGTIFVLPLLILVITGTLFNISKEIRAIPNFPSAEMVDWVSAVEQAQGLRPRSTIRMIARQEYGAIVEFREGGRVYVSPGHRPTVSDPWTMSGWIEAAYPVHSGRIVDGWSLRVIFFFTALASIVLGVTGWMLRLTRLRKSQQDRA